MYQLDQEQIDKVRPFFEGWDDSPIWSCLDGSMGDVYVDDIDSPAIAYLVVFCFGYIAGDSASRQAEKMAGFLPKGYDEIILVPENKAWETVIEKAYCKKKEYRIDKITRYAIKKEGNKIFDMKQLQEYVNQLPKGYEIKEIDEKLFYEVKKEEWSQDFTNAFESYETFKQAGIFGFLVLHGDKIVCGTAPFSYYKGGIEIEVGTHYDYRRRGLALSCSARFILECIARDLYPAWDAANMMSVGLAEKLGYHFDKDYMAYEIWKK